MAFILSARASARLDHAALRAAGQRRQEDGAHRSSSATASFAVFAAAGYARTRLRRVLRLRQWVPVISSPDDFHRLIDGSLSPAIRLLIPSAAEPREFLAAYDSTRHFTLSPIGPCPRCAAPVPTMCINDLADYGDWLGGAQDLAESPHYRTSPAHRRDCPLPLQPLTT